MALEYVRYYLHTARDAIPAWGQLLTYAFRAVAGPILSEGGDGGGRGEG